jgi:hypothetical protein
MASAGRQWTHAQKENLRKILKIKTANYMENCKRKRMYIISRAKISLVSMNTQYSELVLLSL